MFYKTPFLSMLLNVRKHAILYLHVYHEFYVRLTCVLKTHVLLMLHNFLVVGKFWLFNVSVNDISVIYSRAMKTQHPNVHQYLKDILNILLCLYEYKRHTPY